MKRDYRRRGSGERLWFSLATTDQRIAWYRARGWDAMRLPELDAIPFRIKVTRGLLKNSPAESKNTA